MNRRNGILGFGRPGIADAIMHARDPIQLQNPCGSGREFVFDGLIRVARCASSSFDSLSVEHVAAARAHAFIEGKMLLGSHCLDHG